MTDPPESDIHADAVARAVPLAAVRDHLANERTLLAWVRTAITVIGLGFIVGRFVNDGAGGGGWGVWLGAVLALAGAATVLAGLRRYLVVEREIDTETYHSAPLVHVILTGVVAIMALLIFGYLVLIPAPQL